jgi:hypothetical protein
MSRKVIDILSSSSSSVSDDDDDDAMDTFDHDLYRPEVLDMASDTFDPEFHDPKNQAVLRQIDTVWRAFPEPRPVRLAPLLLRMLRAKSDTEKANVIDAAWRTISPTELGVPLPFSRLESFQLTRALSRVTALLAQGHNEDMFDVRSRLSTFAPVCPLAALRLLDGNTWVDDEGVDAFGAILEGYLNHNGTRVAYLPTFVWKDRAPYKSIRRFLGPEHGDFLRSSKFLFAPVHRSSHWTLIVFKLTTGECLFFNSFSSDWSRFSGEEERARFHVIVTCLRAQVPHLHKDMMPTAVVPYPKQFDGTSCALYVMHCMECLASASHENQFQQRTWDHKAELLRLHVFMCLLLRRWRPLRTSLAQPQDDDLLMSDDLMDDDMPVRYDFSACTTCGTTDKRLLVCLPWHLAFCGTACQSKHAKTHQLHY